MAVGESGCIPPAQSLIADYFGRAERPRAVAIFMLGAPLSVVMGYFLAGWLDQFYGWRATFVILGLPGLPLAALVWTTLKDPRSARSPRDAQAATSSKRRTIPDPSEPDLSLSVRHVVATLWSSRTFRHLLFSTAVVYFFGTGMGQWQPAFLIRSYGFKTGELGTWFAVFYGVGGTLGTYLGGEWASRRAAANERLQLKAMAIIYSVMAIVWATLYSTHNKYVAFTMMGVAAVAVTLTSGPLFATIQTLVPERMRATSIALIYLFSNLIGAGLGPLAVGALSDALHPMYGEESLRYALVAMCPGYLWCGWHLWAASKSVTRDLVALQYPRSHHEGDYTVSRSASAPPNRD